MTEGSGTVNFKKLGPAGFLIAIVCIAVVAGGLFTGETAMRTTFAQSYLYGWFFWAMITLGCLGLNFLHHTLRASWSLSLIRMFEAASSPLSLLVTALGFVPIFLNRALIYPWANHEIHSHILERKAWYLNDNFFIIRFVTYFAIWMFISNVLRKSSQKQDETLDDKLGVKRQTTGPVGLVFFFVTMTFATTDWLMSLEPQWYSTLLPLLVCIGAGLTAMSLCVTLLLMNRDKQPYAQAISTPLTKDLGNILFMLTMVWGYMTLSQYLITYSGNLPEEVPYYIKRNESGWQILSGLIVLIQFFIPFTVLLASRVKRYAKNLIAVAIMIFAIRIFDMYWVIMPSMRGREQSLMQSVQHWQDWIALLGFGGLWFGMFGAQVHQAAILPKHDTRLLELEHAH